MDALNVQRLWNVSNALDDHIEHLVWSGEKRGEDIKTIQAIDKELNEVIEYINNKYPHILESMSQQIPQ